MKIKKHITLTTHIQQPRQPGPLSQDEAKQLTDFFVALIDLKLQEPVKTWSRDDINK
ncbi:hypothetical protein [Candidatus Chromulinivorax destructor]|uniref:hypothetical protein n=1 Tax=Candidatus Chromulinivorax destructor TaxID=2066483 RepID=UPI0013B40BAB|nr:hypothetical protein [Candidatus Chromulinivorax destructor]